MPIPEFTTLTDVEVRMVRALAVGNPAGGDVAPEARDHFRLNRHQERTQP